LFWIWFRGRIEPVNVDGGLDFRSRHRPLAISGAIICGLGLLLGSFVYRNWDYLVSVVKISGGAQAIVVAVGILVIGLALLWASRPPREQLAA
jgi:hypothetical protein